MPTNVLNLPGNYKIVAQDGYIIVDATGSPTQGYILNKAGTFIANTANTFISNVASGAYIFNEAGSYISNKSSDYIKNDAGAYIQNLASTNITNETTNGYIKNDAGSYVENVAADYIKNDSSGYITNLVSSYVTYEIGDYLDVDASGYIKLVSGDYVELEGGNIRLKATSDYIRNIASTYIEFDTPETRLGASENQDIKPVGRFSDDVVPKAAGQYNLGLETNTWNELFVEKGKVLSEDNVNNPYNRPYNPGDIYGTQLQREAGSLYVAGGVGIEKDLNVGGFIYGRIETATTSLSINVTSTNIDQIFYPTIALNTGNQFLFIDSTGTGGGFNYNPAYGKLTTERARVLSTDSSTSTVTGAFTVTGGVGIGGDVYIGGNITPATADSQSIGAETFEWAEGYINDLYSKFIGSTSSNLTVAPGGGQTDIFGDIRVRGTNPIGTAPIVRNTLYVTMDGNDTNDGRAMDSSRACRTIGGALNSPYYQEGTQILVSAGHYLEDNPLVMKRYTSIRGSDIRTTFIEPINKTQDLFHMNSGCYLNYMTFLNGRSGLLEGPYERGFNRGAYATAFPPLINGEQIVLNQSPYVQNCTNQSGPWLKDGTLFIPNQTVQVPSAVGTGTWSANTTTIDVRLNTGTVSIGMSINAGAQNPGFFNARTLMLANKDFIKEQVVTYVDQTFNSGNFNYDRVKCARDTGLIIDSIATDLLQNSESESIFAGLQYWRQTGYVDAIGGQITTTTNAITFLQTEAFNTLATLGLSTGAVIVSSRFADILSVLNSGTTYPANLANGQFSEWVTNSIQSNYTATTSSFLLSAYSTLQSYKSTLTNATINYIQTNNPGFSFNTATCIRDIGYIIDSVSYDLTHGGNKQSIKSGVYYFGYGTNTSEVAGEIPQVQSAYKFLKSIISDVVQGVPRVTLYQTTASQTIVGFNKATVHEAEALSDKIDIITNIIRNGPDDYQPVGKRVPINLTTNTTTGVLNAYELLLKNRDFIVKETIAYINTTSNYFEYNREKCRRDVGILVENLSYDAAFGGNQKAVESGLAYYDGVISKIAGQEVQTIAAIDYLNALAQKVITNTVAPDLLSGTGTYAQVINTALVGGTVASDTFDNLINIVTTIIDNGPDAAPTIYTSPGPDSAFISAETLIQANRTFIQQETISYINNVIIPLTHPGYFPYSEIKCRRDTALVIDAIAQDLLYPTADHSQSTFAGLQYWKQSDYVGDIKNQLNPTVDAIEYLKETAVKIIQNITPADDLVARYHVGAPLQDTSTYQTASSEEVALIQENFDTIISIVGGNKLGWTDRIVPNGTPSTLRSRLNAYNLLQANKAYLGYEVTAYVDTTNPGFNYDRAKCRRDVGYMVDAIAFDLLHGGNRQAIQNGLYYYGFSATSTNIYNETTQTVAAFNTLSYIVSQIIQGIPVTPRQKRVKQVFTSTTATSIEASAISVSISTITSIILNGPNVAAPPSAISLTASTSTAVNNAYDLIYKNKAFIIEEVIDFVDNTFNPGAFNYDESKCFRDVGLILDAVTQDIVLGGNSKSIEAGLSYWSAGYNAVGDQLSTTTMAINHVRDIALKVAANVVVTATTGTVLTQTINPFFQYGEEYGPQEAIARNFKIITDILNKGPEYAPPVYAGGGLFTLAGVNGADVKIAPKITSVESLNTLTNTFRLGLSTATIGFGINSTLYIGETLVFPYRDYQVDAKSYELAGNTGTWALRKVDQVGAMGGSLVDGASVSEKSPIQSFVYDAFTQVNQGGRGIHIINDGYAQLVSVFTIFCSTSVEVDGGGIASITNSNANFGNLCLVSKGYGKRKFTGHVYNPGYKAYPESPNIPGSEYLNQYYPTGFWPNDGKVMVFLPDLEDRPHISLVMEVVPPDYVRDYTGSLVPQVNEQGFPGFLNSNPTTSTLNTGSIIISGIDTDGIAIGNAVYARDQYGFTTSTIQDSSGNFIQYVQPGTIVTDVGYQTVTLNKPLGSGGADPTNTDTSINTNYFDLYFCGNAYYTVLSSEVGRLPQYNRDNIAIPDNVNILSEDALGLPQQIDSHANAMRHLNSLTNKVISNTVINAIQTGTNTSTQFVNLLVSGGSSAGTFIDLRFKDLITIITATNLTAAEAVVKPAQRTTSGPAVQGAGAAVSLITANIDFLADEIAAYVAYYNWGPGGTTPLATYSDPEKEQISVKCRRDTKIILQRLIYDIESGGRYNMVMSGLSYWRRSGSYHIVQLGETVTRTDLFPDGATVNFYQRSYISASGYLFEYVGAGVDYGALPQRGVADPKQGQEVVQLNSGKVFFTSTDQNGDFRIGPGLIISQATGVLSGRTFTRSLFANMTPFILAIEFGGA
jgi:hypothetical protein